ncbi:kinase-like domain-containing protein [Mycena sp. CBHHK59/15]|nr:kinase-like domain-containing protein [Mycena sp. CBHHK59/15]
MPLRNTATLPTFEIGDDYQVLHVIGQGSYGIVAAALHKPTGRKVAIKRIIPFGHTLFCLRTLRELKLLKFFSESCLNDNIISIVDIIKPASLESFTEIYFIQELMGTDLSHVIRLQHLTDDHCRYFIYQTLRALKSIHSADVIHRDLKPANLLINANCELKVADFGLARSVMSSATSGEQAGLMTEYVATRWYRAPEIMLSFKMYTKAIDIWAVGCILAELLSGVPLFPGRDYGHQLNLILDVTGSPGLDEVNAITSKRSRDYLLMLPKRPGRYFPALFPHAPSEAIDFLSKTLGETWTFDPTKRLTVYDALEHPYLEAYHDPEDEPSAIPLNPSYFQFDFNDKNPTNDQLKELLYKEVLSLVPSIS